MVSHFVVGEENAGLRYLFGDKTIHDLFALSPIVLYGEKGSGKTALSITLAVRWARMTKSRPLCFTTGKAFVTDYAAAVEIDDIASFRSRHRECKLLILDDLEPLSEKKAAQDELVNTLDALHESRSPVIVSVAQLPSATSGIKSSLASRLAGGYSIPLRRPDKLSQLALIQALVKDIDKSLSAKDIADFCTSLSKTPRVQDLKTIVTMAQQNKSSSGSVDFSTISQLLRQHFSGESLSIADIARIVARKMRVKLSDMRGSTREAGIVRARGLAILLARKLTPASLQQIGEFFGGRDHSTVLHAYRKTNLLIESDSELSKTLADVQADLLR